MEVRTSEFDYELPEDRIAAEPAAHRSDSKLLCYKGGSISHHRFTGLPDVLPPDALLVFNNTRVIPARLHFHTAGGAMVEIFLLNPSNPDGRKGSVTDFTNSLSANGRASWVCMIGNQKRWKPDAEVTLNAGSFVIKAVRTEAVVHFSWEPATLTFAEVMDHAGKIPLPPYIRREATDADTLRYQTVYAKSAGAVAAPTAGLHFTEDILQELSRRGIPSCYLTLHVGAGTFLPVKSEDIRQHQMHEESFVVEREVIERLAAHQGPVIPVGTTSMRTLETLYWLAQRQRIDSSNKLNDPLDQEFAYSEHGLLPPRHEQMKFLLEEMKVAGLNRLEGSTSIFIRPGYQMRVCSGIITNFHQPRSTLLMLICALIGEDWKRVYEEALRSDYRFLSYGDSSLLMP